MTTCLGKSFSFGLPRVPFVNCCQFYVFSYFPFGFEGMIWDLIVSVSDHCLSFYLIHMAENGWDRWTKENWLVLFWWISRKAFDLVDHSILLKKIKLYNFNQNSRNLFKSYLTNKQQSVFINKTQSNHASVKHRVPQGSIL